MIYVCFVGSFCLNFRFFFLISDNNKMENPSLHVLSADQLALLNKTWEIPAANPGDSGEAIFYRFFEKHPEHQADFPNFKGLALGDLKVGRHVT